MAHPCAIATHLSSCASVHFGAPYTATKCYLLTVAPHHAWSTSCSMAVQWCWKCPVRLVVRWYLLAALGGEIFVHTLVTARSVLEDPPSISEGCGGRVTDYRITVRYLFFILTEYCDRFQFHSYWEVIIESYIQNWYPHFKAQWLL
jgi:hypothetical protein